MKLTLQDKLKIIPDMIEQDELQLIIRSGEYKRIIDSGILDFKITLEAED